MHVKTLQEEMDECVGATISSVEQDEDSIFVTLDDGTAFAVGTESGRTYFARYVAKDAVLH
jgi:bisphosphoglycerate-independent phosphoglycerate mutase (AlkP superfamily)